MPPAMPESRVAAPGRFGFLHRDGSAGARKRSRVAEVIGGALVASMLARTMRVALVASVLCLIAGKAVCEASEQWRLLSETEIWKLSVAENMTRRNGDKVLVRYLLEHPVAYDNQSTGRRYRGTVVNATIDCGTKTYVLGDLTSYAEAGGRGKAVDRFSASGAQPERIVAGSTFDILRKHVCGR